MLDIISNLRPTPDTRADARVARRSGGSRTNVESLVASKDRRRARSARVVKDITLLEQN